eukprot:TRINITY_DN2404_c0_g1_i2.p1 TRINITY_DN2404_c0_g1~~TRINITY_DN2404_c0_g1_i2.p1  ORF type:complete len:141 (-),score=4.42 TRINITY_DN2404_c0_g1_i2:27-449(-)
MASTDKLSAQKIAKITPQITVESSINLINRNREVGQSLVAGFCRSIVPLFQALRITWKYSPDIILCNGPGSCIPIVFSAILMRIFLFRVKPVVIYIESFCRTQSLSITGKILYFFVDRFLVQWPSLANKFKRAEFVGQLC